MSECTFRRYADCLLNFGDFSDLRFKSLDLLHGKKERKKERKNSEADLSLKEMGFMFLFPFNGGRKRKERPEIVMEKMHLRCSFRRKKMFFLKIYKCSNRRTDVKLKLIQFLHFEKLLSAKKV
jgi:hypothetical protein